MKRRVLLAVVLAFLLAGAGAGCGNGNWSSGDRVLVAKYPYDMGVSTPRRWDVVVFRFPKEPIRKGVPKNYIKRLLGLPGQLLALLFGNVYVASAPPSHDDSNVPEQDLWQAEYMNRGNVPNFLHFATDRERATWAGYKFEIQRKPLGTMLAMRRLVHDNDFQPKKTEQPVRWDGAPGSKWAAEASGTAFRNPGTAAELEWLRYRHLVRPSDPATAPKEQLITDFEAYNAYTPEVELGKDPKIMAQNIRGYTPHNWVGDLMLECKVQVEAPRGELVLRLAKGIEFFEAAWDLASGDCTLYRTDKEGKNKTKLDTQPTAMKAAGEYDLRFANVDARLTVWVNGSTPFGDGKEYAEPADRGPTDNDLKPASVGAKGAAVRVRSLRIWRDTYYTLKHDVESDAEADRDRPPEGLNKLNYAEAKTFAPLRTLPARLLYVQPKHYLCLGDNSPQSSDSRDWGTVPERLMLGRALMVYYPFNRAGRIQ